MTADTLLAFATGIVIGCLVGAHVSSKFFKELARHRISAQQWRGGVLVTPFLMTTFVEREPETDPPHASVTTGYIRESSR